MTPAEKKAQQRAALRALLAKPLLVADTDSEKLVLVRRHLPDLREWLSRETGWRLVADSETARLFKTATVLSDASRPARGGLSVVPRKASPTSLPNRATGLPSPLMNSDLPSAFRTAVP